MGSGRDGGARAIGASLGVTRTRELGVLTVNAHAYEDFLQTADAAIAALAEHARGAGQFEKADPSEALQAGDAAYRLGAAACALGLGHVALLADALGLAWRRRAHAGVSTPAVRAHVIVSAPDAQALEQGAEALRAMLHKIAAGVAPPAAGPALAALTLAIEQGEQPDPQPYVLRACEHPACADAANAVFEPLGMRHATLIRTVGEV